MKRPAWVIPCICWLLAVAPPPLLYRATVHLWQVDRHSWLDRWVEYPFIAVWLTPVGVWLWLASSLCLVWSRTARWWSYLLLAAWALPWGVWMALLVREMPRLDAWLYHGGLRMPTGDPLLARMDAHVALALGVSGFISVPVLGFATRSRVVAFTTLAAAPLGLAWTFWGYAVIPWFAATCGSMILWAVRSRRTLRPGMCPWCGYDLTGLAPNSPCPECGKGAAA